MSVLFAVRGASLGRPPSHAAWLHSFERVRMTYGWLQDVLTGYCLNKVTQSRSMKCSLLHHFNGLSLPHPWCASHFQRRWIMPTTNAHGYAARRREENQMDPNRDFPYLQRPEFCMKTQTARAVNDTQTADVRSITQSQSAHWYNMLHTFFSVIRVLAGGIAEETSYFSESSTIYIYIFI